MSLISNGQMLRFSRPILKKISSFKMCKRSIQQNMQKPFTIIVEGNIGSGKTTFINFFKNNRNILTLSEPIQEWKNINGYNLLDMMYKDLNEWAFTFQTYVQLTMARLHEIKTQKPVKMLERSIFSARYCFVENLSSEGILAPAQVAVLDEWFKWIISREGMTCDLIVYLRTSPEVAYERIRQRNREEEVQITKEYVTKLHEYHENWLCRKKGFNCPARVLVLDANKDLQNIQQEYKAFQNEVNCSVKNVSHLI